MKDGKDGGATIVHLQVENVKRVVAVEIDCEGESAVVLGGRNKQGKTSVLDAIMYAFAGGRSIPDKPVHEGADGAHVEVTLDNGLIVRREWTADGKSKIVVKSADGGKFTNPQGMLDALLGDLTFDPMEFDSMKADKRVETLCRIVGLDVADLDRKRKSVFDERTEIGRELKTAKGYADGLPEYPGAEPVDVSALLAEQTAALATVKAAEEADRVALKAGTAERDASEDVVEAEQQVAKWTKALAERKAVLAEATAAVDAAKVKAAESRAALVDREPINARIASAGQANAQVQANEAKAKATERVGELQAKVDGLTAKIDALDADKLARIAAVSMPVPGMAIGDDDVTLDGLPWEQGSDAQRLEASVALGFAANPKLRVVFVRNASLLDDEHRKHIYRLAQKHGGQAWLEIVGTGDDCSVVIEDGRVRGA